MTESSPPPESTRPALEEQATHLFRPGENDGVWYVFHTRPRCEKKAAKICLDNEIRHYLPTHKSHPKPRKGQRRYSFDVPLFPGYMFGCCNHQERYTVMRSNYLVRTIDVTDQRQLLEELYNIYLATSGQVEVNLYPQLKRGRWVRVIDGPLRGVTGRISTRKENLRLVLNVSILGTAVAAEVHMGQVEPLTG
jgi:transcription antitermination factor NusG